MTDPDADEVKQAREALPKLLRARGIHVLADLHRAGVLMIEDHAFPARLWLIGHALREIRNRAPELLGYPKVDDVPYSGVIDGIKILWMEEVRSQLVTDDGSGLPKDPIELRRNLAEQIDGLVAKHIERAEARQQVQRAFFSADASGKAVDELVDEWTGIKAHKYAHVPVEEIDAGQWLEECIRLWCTMEVRLNARLASEQEAYDRIDKELEEANTSAD